MLRMSEEPVVEINHSSNESDDADALVVEEHPLREIIQELSTSSKNSPVKKELKFNKSDEKFSLFL